MNRVDGPSTISVAELPPKDLKPGVTVYRNFDKQFSDRLSGNTAVRTIGLSMTLRRVAGMLCLEADGVTATVDLPEWQAANTPQTDARRRALAKLGGTEFRLASLTDMLGDEFVPASVMTELRRKLVEMLRVARQSTYHFDRRRQELSEAKAPQSALTYHANVANAKAERVYHEHGVTGPVPKAPEVEVPKGEVCVMHTRYCLRREMGKCLRTPPGSEWKEPLTLAAPGLALTPHFHCDDCHMTLTYRN